MNIVLVGHVCIDHNTTENATYTGWGSSVLYMAHYLHDTRLSQPTVVSSYGPDMLPYLSGIKIFPGAPNQPETLVYENDTRAVPRIWKAHQTIHAVPPAITSEISTLVSSADIVIVAPLLPNYSVSFLRDLIGRVHSSALTVLCPQGYLRDVDDNGLVSAREFVEAPDIIPLFDMVIYSQEDHPNALQLANDWRKNAADTKIIVTQGPDGASILDKDGKQHIPTKPIDPKDIVDSVGCGDVFAITTAYQYKLSGDLTEAVQKAHKSASRKLLGTARK